MDFVDTTQIKDSQASSKFLLWGTGCLGLALLAIVVWFFMAIAVLNYFSAPRRPNVSATNVNTTANEAADSATISTGTELTDGQMTDRPDETNRQSRPVKTTHPTQKEKS